mgnify:CR=1 FL=1
MQVNKSIKKFFKIISIVVIVSVIAVLTYSSIEKSKAEKISIEKSAPRPDGIESLEQVVLGKEKQWILVRGEKKSNPVLLFLHGGPGSAEISFAREFDRQLEKEFVVVNWDQRGSGKSFSLPLPSDISIERFLSDTNELILLLQKRFGVKKIYLVGHSWGSYLGAITAHRHPENLYAYIGIGQMVNAIENEKLSHEFALAEAIKDKNELAIMELKSISPPYKELRDMGKEREWLMYYGGGMFYGEHR